MIPRRLVIVTLGSVLAVGCNKKSADSSSPPSPAKLAEQATGQAPRGNEPLALPDGIPASAALVGALEAPADWVTSTASWGLFDASVTQAAVADLDAYLVKTTGLSVSKLHRAAFFVTAEGKPAALIADVGGEWKGRPPGDAKIVVRGSWLIVGEPSAVDLAVATAEGKSPALAKDSVLAKLFAKESKGAFVAAAMDFSQLPPKDRGPIDQFGIERAALAFGAQLRAVVEGKPDGLAKLVEMYDKQAEVVVGMLEGQRAAALANASLDAGPQPEALGMIVGSHFVRAAVKLLRPQLDGNALHVHVDLPGNAATVVPVIGILAAVAVPAFTSYMRHSATVHVDRRQDCELACRHAFEVAYWEKADADLAAAPANTRDALRKKRLADFTTLLDDGLDTCVTQCVSANNDAQNQCLLAAKTKADLDHCTE